MMASWLIAGRTAHYGFTHPATGVIFQSEDEDRALHDVAYVKCLWARSIAPLRETWKLSRAFESQAESYFELDNGSWFLGIVGDPNKIRSEHPTIVVFDEAAHMTRLTEAYGVAINTRCLHTILLSSANPGPFQEMVEGAVPVDWPAEDMPDEPVERVTVPPEVATLFVTGTQAGVKPRLQPTPTVRTPCPGLMLKMAPDGMPVIRMHYTADPRWPEWLPKELAKQSTQAIWDLEMEILYEANAGLLVFPEFGDAHIIAHDQIPTQLCRFMAIDPHPRTPHACLWLGIDRFDDWYIYDELWPSVYYGQWKRQKDTIEENFFHVKEYAEIIADKEGNALEWRDEHRSDKERAIYRRQPGGHRVVRRFMDQAGKGFRSPKEFAQTEESLADRYANYGIKCEDPVKSHDAGYEAVHLLLKPRPHEFHENWPRLHVSERCIETILEMRKHRYQSLKSGNDERELKQEGVQVRCHMVDLLRYLATAHIRFIPTLAS